MTQNSFIPTWVLSLPSVCLLPSQVCHAWHRMGPGQNLEEKAESGNGVGSSEAIVRSQPPPFVCGFVMVSAAPKSGL